MDERERKIGENEILYRAVNEKIEALNSVFGAITDVMTVVCECGDGTCAEQIDIDVPSYERVRRDPTLFITLPGHEIEDVERVVEQHDAFEIVQKDSGGPADLARRHDPRR